MATTNYSWNLPTVGGSEDAWGTQLNANWTALDTLLGGTNATEFAILGGATVSTAELNLLDGVTWTLTDLNALTAAGLALLDDADAAAQRTTLGLGNIATTDLIDEDDMASDTAARAPTQQSVKAYVDSQVDANGITQTTGSAPYYGARAWGKLSGGTLNAGGNIASVSNPITGQYDITFTTAMPDANYAVVALGHDLSGFTSGGTDANDIAWVITAQSTTGFTLNFETVGDDPLNMDSVSFVVFR